MYMGKSFLGGFYCTDENYGDVKLLGYLNDFYAKHNWCGGECEDLHEGRYDKEMFPLPKINGSCDGAFDIVYETNDGNQDAWPSKEKEG